LFTEGSFSSKKCKLFLHEKSVIVLLCVVMLRIGKVECAAAWAASPRIKSGSGRLPVYVTVERWCEIEV
jgi:hypothetical protein